MNVELMLRVAAALISRGVSDSDAGRSSRHALAGELASFGLAPGPRLVDELRVRVSWNPGFLRELIDGLERTMRADLAAAVARDDHALVARVAVELGVLLTHDERAGDALAVLEQARSATVQVSDRTAEAKLLGELGLAHASVAQWDAARTLLEQARAAFDAIGDFAGAAKADALMGIMATRRHDLATAARRFRASIDGAQNAGDPAAAAQGAVALAFVRSAAGETDEALQLAADAARTAPGFDPQLAATVQFEAGLIAQYAGHLDDAAVRYQAAADAYRLAGDAQGEATAHGNLGTVRRAQRRWEEASDLFRQVSDRLRAIGDWSGSAQATMNLGNVLLNAGRPEDARRVLESALIVYRAAGPAHGEAHTLANLGLALLQAGDRSAAIDTLKASARLLESLGDEAAIRAVHHYLDEAQRPTV